MLCPTHEIPDTLRQTTGRFGRLDRQQPRRSPRRLLA